MNKTGIPLFSQTATQACQPSTESVFLPPRNTDSFKSWSIRKRPATFPSVKQLLLWRTRTRVKAVCTHATHTSRQIGVFSQQHTATCLSSAFPADTARLASCHSNCDRSIWCGRCSRSFPFLSIIYLRKPYKMTSLATVTQVSVPSPLSP